MKTHLYIGSTFAVFPNALSQAKNIKSATKPTHQDRNEWITKDKNKARTGNKRYKTLGLSGYSSVLPRIKFGITRQEGSPQSPTISYRQPLCVILNGIA